MGSAVYVATREEVKCSNMLLYKPHFEVHMVAEHKERIDNQVHYEVTSSVGGECFSHTLPASELRLDIHDVIREKLSSKEYQRLRLGRKFPCWRWVGSMSLCIQDYLEQLAVAMVDPDFPQELVKHVDQCLFGGLLDVVLGNCDSDLNKGELGFPLRRAVKRSPEMMSSMFCFSDDE